MKKLYSTTALLLVLSLSGPITAFAHADKDDKDNKSYVEETISALPAKDAAKFRDTMRQAHEKNMAIADQVHELHDELDGIMAAEPFDQDAFRDKSAKLRAVYEQMRSNTDDAFASAAAQLSQKEREQVATAMAYPHKKHVKPTAAQ